MCMVTLPYSVKIDNNVTELSSVLVAATSAILLLNASKLLAIVVNGTHPMFSLSYDHTENKS